MTSLGAAIRSPATRAGLAAWLAAMVLMAVADRNALFISLGIALYSAVLLALTLWLIPQRVTPADDDAGEVLRAPRDGRLGARLAVAFGSNALVLAWYTAVGMVMSGAHVPLAAQIMRGLAALYRQYHLEGYTTLNFVLLALLPGLLLLALGTKPRALGLSRPVRGSGRATWAALAVPIVLVIVAFARGRLSVLGLLGLLIHNFFSNGFSEEFSARGVVFSHLRAVVRTDWAMVGQALFFSLLHFGGTIAEEHGNVSLIVANVVAENFPIAIALGVMALRSRSLVMPTAVHVSLDTMKDLLM